MNIDIDQIVLVNSVPVVITGYKMDPNYVYGRRLFNSADDPNPILYVPKLEITALTLTDVANITSIQQFHDTYPEYFL